MLRAFGVRSLAALMFAGCGPVSPVPDEPFLLAKARAAVAFAEAEVARSEPDASPSICDACKGTKTILSGDGLVRVPCECGERCRCEPPFDAAPVHDTSRSIRKKRLLYFTAEWCATCRANEPAFAALRRRGWRIGPGEENHIQTVELDVQSDLQSRYGVDSVPTWVLIDDGREAGRRFGVLDALAIGRMFEE